MAHTNINFGHQDLIQSSISGDAAIDIENVDKLIVEGDFYENPEMYFIPSLGVMHTVNAEMDDLWLWTDDEIPLDMQAWMMKNVEHGGVKGYAALYTGDISYENQFDSQGKQRVQNKPIGAKRYLEILGYDCVYPYGSSYEYKDGWRKRTGAPGDYLSANQYVSAEWCIMQTYRAVGQEQYTVYSHASPAPGDFTTPGARQKFLNNSPVLSILPVAVKDADLSGYDLEVAATRTNMVDYLDLAAADALDFTTSFSIDFSAEENSWIYHMPDPNSDPSIRVSIAEFCVLVQDLMELYGEPVITDQEKLLLLQAYGRVLPYHLIDRQFDAVEYLMCRGIVDETLDWNAPITLDTACTILMRVKDKGSRLTFKEIQLTADVALLEKGYHETTVALQDTGLISVDPYSDYSTYTYYDYLVQLGGPNAIGTNDGAGGAKANQFDGFMNDAGTMTKRPFVAKAKNKYQEGTVSDSQYLGVISLGPYRFYHFRVPIDGGNAEDKSCVWINTNVKDDKPGQIQLPLGGGLYTFPAGENIQISDGIRAPKRYTFDEMAKWLDVPEAYCDRERRDESIKSAESKMSGMQDAGYGFIVKFSKAAVEKDDSNIFVRLESGDIQLKELTNQSGYKEPTGADDSEGGLKLKSAGRIMQIESNNDIELTYRITGVSSETIKNVFFNSSTNEDIDPVAYPAFSKRNEEFLLAVDYLKDLGIVTNFEEISSKCWHISVNTAKSTSGGSYVSEIYVTLENKYPMVLRGNMLTIYPQDKEIIYVTNQTYYVDYEVILGASPSVAFNSEDNSISLDAQPIGSLQYVTVSNRSATAMGAAGSDKSTSAYMLSEYTVGIPAAGSFWLVTSMGYPLANYVAIHDKASLGPQLQVVSFWPTTEEVSANSAMMEPIKELESTYGIQVPEGYYVITYHIPPQAQQQSYNTWIAEKKADDAELSGSMQYGVVYLKDINSVLLMVPNVDTTDKATTEHIYTTHIKPADDAKFTVEPGVNNSKEQITEDLLWLLPLLYKETSGHSATTRSLIDGQYNVIALDQMEAITDPFYVVIPKTHTGEEDREFSWAIWEKPTINMDSGGLTKGESPLSISQAVKTTPAAAGVCLYIANVGHRMKGSSDRLNLSLYNGIMGMTMNSLASTVTYGGQWFTTLTGEGLVLCQAPKRLVLQTSNFEFGHTEFSVFSTETTVTTQNPQKTGETTSWFDWLAFLKDAKMSDADDILTICIIAVLSILPRIFMFIFMCLIALALIADAKPWQAFCDQVIDPYKLLTAGRQTVHTVRTGSMVFWSMVALALFGLFQNGLILDLIGWLARGVTGILNR